MKKTNFIVKFLKYFTSLKTMELELIETFLTSFSTYLMKHLIFSKTEFLPVITYILQQEDHLTLLTTLIMLL